MYKGGFYKNLRNGLGEIYNEFQEIEYYGHFMNGVKDRDGILYHKNGNVYYEGFFKENEPNCDRGTFFYEDGR